MRTGKPNSAWRSVGTKPKHENIAVAGLCKRLGLEMFLSGMRLRPGNRAKEFNLVAVSVGAVMPEIEVAAKIKHLQPA